MTARTETCDVLVLGGTPGGIATAVRTAREGLDTHLVTYNRHLGGVMASGLSCTDTTTKAHRAPILSEFFERVREHYRETHGEDSAVYENCDDGYLFEPHVAQGVFEDLVEEESTLTVTHRHHPIAAEQSGREIESVRLRPMDDAEGTDEDDGSGDLRVSAETFVDSTYTGDLMAVANVPYRIGRESRRDFDEQFAGEVYNRMETPEEKSIPPGHWARDRDDRHVSTIVSGSTGEGDDAIQAYNYRVTLTNDPENRRSIEAPAGYDRDEFAVILEDEADILLDHPFKDALLVRDVEEVGFRYYVLLRDVTNGKTDLNTADLPGLSHDYPEADWEERRKIERKHREHVLGLLYFLQNDPAVPEAIREEASQWGLPRDEFPDNENFPWQLYVREARRLVGRETFTEQDARLAPDSERTPVREDAIAIAEYPMDVHVCRPIRRPGTRNDGQVFLGELTYPSQIPYGSLLPERVDNLLVPVCLSATHVGWATIRLEPTWMHVGESAGFAAALAHEGGTTPGDLSVPALKHRLVESGVMLTWFDDLDGFDGVDSGEDATWTAAQYLGSEGVFDTYRARPGDALARARAIEWVRALAHRRTQAQTANDTSVVGTVDRTDDGEPAGSASDPITVEELGLVLADGLPSGNRASHHFDAALDDLEIQRGHDLTRGAAAKLLYASVFSGANGDGENEH